MDSRFGNWPAGDTYFIYPGDCSSIRFERLREGIQDAEKIRLLRSRLASSTDVDAPAKLTKLNNTVANFNRKDSYSNNGQSYLQRGGAEV